MEKIYTYEGTLARSGWQYKVRIIGRGSALGAYEEIKLPRGCFKIGKISWEYEKYPLGLTAKTFEAEIKLYLMSPEMSQYDKLFELLYDGLSENYSTGALGLEMKYWTGTIIELWVKFNNNADSDVNFYRRVFHGMIRDGQETEDAAYNAVYKINADDLVKCAIDEMKLTNTWLAAASASSGDIFSAYGYIDYYIDTLPKKLIGQYYGREFQLKFIPITALDEVLTNFASYVYSKTSRNSSATLEIEVPLPKVYRQTYDGSGQRGAELSRSEIYILALVDYKGEFVAGLLHPDDENGLAKTYNGGGCLWDLLNDAYTATCRRAWTDSDEIISTPFLGQFSATPILASGKKLLPKFDHPSKVLKKATSSLYESMSGSVSDMDNYEAAGLGTRNGEELSIPMFFNTMPSQGDFERFTDKFLRNVTYDYLSKWLHIFMGADTVNWGKIWLTKGARMQGLFYKDTFNNGTGDTEQMVRVHENPNYIIKAGMDADSQIGFTPVDLSSSNFEQPNAVIAKLQLNSCMMKAAEIMLWMLGDRRQMTAKLKAQIPYLVQFTGGGNNGFVWNNPDTVLQMNWSELNPRMLTDRNQWLMTKSEIDFESEIADVELILGNYIHGE